VPGAISSREPEPTKMPKQVVTPGVFSDTTLTPLGRVVSSVLVVTAPPVATSTPGRGTVRGSPADEDDPSIDDIDEYVLAEKRAPAFKTDGYVLGNGGTSRVNLELLYQFTAMQRLLRTAGNEAQVEQSLKCIRAQFKIPVIQACLLYSHKASSPDLTDDDSLAKIKAEAWAFCSQALPLLHEVDPASAAAVKKTVMLDASDARPDWAIVRDAFSGENVNGMGLKCSDVGALDDGVYQCRDTASLLSQNSYADSAVCGSVRMPNNPSSAAGTASSWIVVGLAAVLSVLGTH